MAVSTTRRGQRLELPLNGAASRWRARRWATRAGAPLLRVWPGKRCGNPSRSPTGPSVTATATSGYAGARLQLRHRPRDQPEGKELTYIASEGYSEADFRHGPIAAIDRGHPVILVAPQGQTLAGMADMAKDLNERGAETLIISNDEVLLRAGTQALPFPAVPEWLSPILSVMTGQVYAMQQALARGYEVDKPRGLSKVTITE